MSCTNKISYYLNQFTVKKAFLSVYCTMIIFHNFSYANDHNLLPETLLQLDNYFSHHVFVAEKSTHTLYVFENKNDKPKLIKKYQMATGKKAGNKIFQGDFRTPEGVYFFTSFIPHEELIKKYGKEGEIYGVGSFVMDYPNPVDRFNGKTGGGIWLHSTNDETRIDKGLDSRGCIVTANNDLKELSKYIELNRTSVIVVHNLKFLSKKAWQTEKDALTTTFNSWLDAWQNEDFEKYISHYSKENFSDPYRIDFNGYKNYKKAVFSNPGTPKINVENISILKAGNYAVITFKQNYQSNTINDTGKKSLYLQKDSYYQWKIVSEKWTKHGIENTEETVAFQPSMRFFKDSQSQQKRNN